MQVSRIEITAADLCALPLFEGLREHDVAWVLDESVPLEVLEGEVLFREGGEDIHFFILLEGRLEVTKRAPDGQEVPLVVHNAPGQFTGEIPMLLESPYMATVTAAEPSRLLRMERASFRRLITYPSISQQMMPVLARRVHAMETMFQQRQKLAALGTLAAGLAHELNNPAAASSRSAEQLHELLPALQPILLRAYDGRLSPAQYQRLDAYLTDLLSRERSPDADPLALSDLEDDISRWFGEHRIVPGWNTASSLAAIDVRREWLDNFARDLPIEMLDDLLRWACITLEINSLLGLVEESSTRISALVKAVKGYSYLDQDPVQDVDINAGLESTLAMLDYKLGGIRVKRQYAPDLPLVPANGSELNQVWTNLLDNAIEAVAGKGTIVVSTRAGAGYVEVDIVDDGPGIPPDMLDRIFEPFFTTKQVGAGAGLGLDVCYSIIVTRHHGDVSVESRPGETRFKVRLPEDT